MPDALIERIRAAYETNAPLIIQGGGSKSFYGNADEGEVLSTRGLAGVVDYQPKELVLTARAGTPLAEIEALLAEHSQMLAFEPPHFGEFPLPGRAPDALTTANPIHATLGGAIAAGLSGPRRPYAGAARDFVLGVRMIDGTGQPLRFGGQVIKNVAGYDVSRLMVGALGTLGLLTEVSLKVLPRPAEEVSLQFELDEATAIRRMNEWAGQPLPLSATSWHAGLLTVRLSGAASSVHAAQAKLGGEPLHDAAGFWQRLRDQATPFFDKRPLWRLAVKSTTPPLKLGEAQWIEWGGAVRWLASDLPAARLREAARDAGGHATLFRGDAPSPQPSPRAGEGANVMSNRIDGVFTPLAPAMLTLHRALKQRFDPKGIFNRGRLYPDF
ncbi:glycolate oxidase subunit GlcE [Thiobacillus sedimenti]|uniref:Glycolate oxidase subunit GlcE n=1 Tax=Thiobacillus sedimenti TaxID=3110231 RepID=A0ABZ1CIV5_9PROT|nr:glycolate oxidase subunit GlcE [Thiobacillus sp. SCUT-2]WRS39330.1 glycolate oxidase subunit GlcE [Thiobacillus sp. SCUT-2]